MARTTFTLSLLAVVTLAACRNADAEHPPLVALAKIASTQVDVAAPCERPVVDQWRESEMRTRRAGAVAKMARAPVPLASPPPPPAPVLEARAAADAAASNYARAAGDLSQVTVTGTRMQFADAPEPNTEKYEHPGDNAVQRASEQPVSTFSIDVDTGSYSNVRRILCNGGLPPADAVRSEEFVNYFDYDYPAPVDRSTPFRVTTELAPAPWNAKRQLLMVGIKGYDVPKAELPPTNLVFLIDTSGSMQDDAKLPLLKQAFAQLVPQLRAQDRVSIVVYAGSAGLVLPPTPGNRHKEIIAALHQLEAGGSTNGGDGIRLAYAMARQSFMRNGVNRVILATDGDFNVGTVDQQALETLVADQRKSGVALTTLGFGDGNYNDTMAEQLADIGDGNHAYIDTLQEARKVLVEEMQATLLTIARDVKIQVEFNPALVSEYRLIGYENRVLKREDFANDKVDAGDIGAGHEVTALYEITPVGSGVDRLPALRYGSNDAAAGNANEVAHLRLRYKLPSEDRSRLIETPIARSAATASPSERLRFASAVAAYADLLRGGTHIDGWSWPQVQAAAQSAIGNDPYGLRREFVGLIGKAQSLGATADGEAEVSGAGSPR